MTTQLTWLGHGSWSIQIDEHQVLLDPFLNDSPVAPITADEVDANVILVSHGHFDHIADVASIANRTGATVVAIFEIAEWFQKNHGVQETIGMNLGGTLELPWGHVKMTPALHSSQLPDGSGGGVAAGFLLTLGKQRVYFACDTALFSDMKLVGDVGVDLAVLPIGDHFTMGPEDSIAAINLIQPRRVAPAHYNTFPPIVQDVEAWALRVKADTSSDPVVIDPGGTISMDS